MAEYVDLHCHYLPSVDDGARSEQDCRLMLVGLKALGFGTVIATPHMRPGLFDNDAPALTAAFRSLVHSLGESTTLPSLLLSAEHYFDDVVFSRIRSNNALPYPGGRAILLEFYDMDFPYAIDRHLAEICRAGMTPVIAHPERYQPIAKNPEILERLLDLGAAALLDIGAVVGKYGRQARRTAESLLERGLYAAACSDAHRPEDISAVASGIEWIARKYEMAEVVQLLSTGPRNLLNGREPSVTTTQPGAPPPTSSRL
jgi:protein-tyrosine phosphatase